MTLAADDGVLDYSCDCPVGSDGAFCKHCVAAALAWLNREAGPAKSPKLGKPKEITLADAGKILRTEDKESLVGMMLDWAKDDDRFHERLILYAARRSGPDTGATAVRRAFEKAVRVRNYRYWRIADVYRKARQYDTRCSGRKRDCKRFRSALTAGYANSLPKSITDGDGTTTH